MANETATIVTSLSELSRWSINNSLWTFALPLSCCGLEFIAAQGPRYDWERFGALVQRNPANADLLIIAGPITQNSAPIIRKIYDEMLVPKFVIAMGVCANSGGLFAGADSEVLPGVDSVVPVDVYVPGCPPRPEALIHGVLSLQRRLSQLPSGTERRGEV